MESDRRKREVLCSCLRFVACAVKVHICLRFTESLQIRLEEATANRLTQAEFPELILQDDA